MCLKANEVNTFQNYAILLPPRASAVADKTSRGIRSRREQQGLNFNAIQRVACVSVIETTTSGTDTVD